MAITKTFVQAGDATFTVQVPADLQAKKGFKAHYTFRVRRLPARKGFNNPVTVVQLLTGPDNTRSYTYLGWLDQAKGEVRTTAKSKLPADSFPTRLVNRILNRVWANDHVAYESTGFHAHHAGKCGRCRRKLTTPESVKLGIGPECCKVLGL